MDRVLTSGRYETGADYKFTERLNWVIAPLGEISRLTLAKPAHNLRQRRPFAIHQDSDPIDARGDP
jgi:hypothetical protein